MSARWTAAAVRGRGLVTHMLGRDGAETIARSRSLAAALEALSPTRYGAELRAAMDIAAAQHAVAALSLWQIRVLAGWSPPLSAGPVRAVAARFEIDNVSSHVAALEGRPAEPPFLLGALGTAWPKVAAADSLPEVRRLLASTVWGDPGGDDAASLRFGLEAAWARQLAEASTDASGWAASYAALLAAKLVVVGAARALAATPSRDLGRLLGHEWAASPSLLELAAHLPPAAAWVISGLEGPAHLWVAEARWWARVEDEAARLSRAPQASESSAVACCMLLLADPWWIRAALEVAAHGGGSLAEVTGAVA